jgi:16S rRNA (guanine966-N2)-methyltransferase
VAGRRSNQVRIIAGQWRGRRVEFDDAEGLRPTPDRLRETLFNWLQPLIPGARCLDLFAGSGALGLEAASRGAAEVVLVERSARVVRKLREQVRQLGGAMVEVMHADAIRWLDGPVRPYDVVFLDPPYAHPELLREACRKLDQGGWLASGARVYLESPRGRGLDLPGAWRVLREKTAGDVSCCLSMKDR